MIRRSISFLIAVLLILAVAGCTAPAANPQPTAAAATAAPADQGAQTGEKMGDTLKIGVVCPLSGSGAVAGKYITNGIKLIENKLTAEGGLLVGDTRYPIQFIYEDNEAKEDITATFIRSSSTRTKSSPSSALICPSAYWLPAPLRSRQAVPQSAPSQPMKP